MTTINIETEIKENKCEFCTQNISTDEKCCTICSTTTLYVDGGHNSQTGDEAWARVVDINGNDMLGNYYHLLSDLSLKKVSLPVGESWVIVSKFNDVKSQQNNGAELLAFVAGLRICTTNKNIKSINSDSELIVKWWSKSGVNPKTKKTMDPKKFAFVEETRKTRKLFEEKGGVINQISGKNNLADLGYHR